MTAMKEEVYTHRCLDLGGMAYHTGPHREAPRSVRRQRAEGTMAQSRTFTGAFKGRNARGGIGRLSKFRIG